MATQGIYINTPIIANDYLRTASTVNTPFLQINSLTLGFDTITGTTNYDVSFRYSIYDSITGRTSLDSINYIYTGITTSFDYVITGDSDTIIQDAYSVITDYFDSAGISYTLVT